MIAPGNLSTRSRVGLTTDANGDARIGRTGWMIPYNVTGSSWSGARAHRLIGWGRLPTTDEQEPHIRSSQRVVSFALEAQRPIRLDVERPNDRLQRCTMTYRGPCCLIQSRAEESRDKLARHGTLHWGKIVDWYLRDKKRKAKRNACTVSRGERETRTAENKATYGKGGGCPSLHRRRRWPSAAPH